MSWRTESVRSEIARTTCWPPAPSRWRAKISARPESRRCLALRASALTGPAEGDGGEAGGGGRAVAAPEGANNADTGGALVPLLTLGIPGGSSTAIMLSALVLWGVKPGPLMMQESPDVFWGLVCSMYVGNVMLLILNLPLVPLFAQILRCPAYILFPAILGISVVGAYGASGRLFDLGLVVGFGLLGYLMGKLKYPSAPLILGFVLGDNMERALRQSLMMSQGDLSILGQRPISAIMLGLAVLILLSPLLGRFNRARVQAITEGG